MHARYPLLVAAVTLAMTFGPPRPVQAQSASEDPPPSPASGHAGAAAPEDGRKTEPPLPKGFKLDLGNDRSLDVTCGAESLAECIDASKALLESLETSLM